jgi:Uma2 family endonuclease
MDEDLSIYPSSDGEPMGETQWHVKQLMMLIDMLEAYFAATTDLVVLANVLLFYEKGNPERFVAPDLCIVRGVPKEPLRSSYFAWKEGKFPDFILELLSEKTAARDRTEKMVLYEQTFGTPEYFLCDPWEKSLDGYRLMRGAYRRIAPDRHNRLVSKTLGVSFGWEDGWVRVYGKDGVRLPTSMELVEENARLRSELEQLKTRRGK